MCIHILSLHHDGFDYKLIMELVFVMFLSIILKAIWSELLIIDLIKDVSLKSNYLILITAFMLEILSRDKELTLAIFGETLKINCRETIAWFKQYL